MIFLTVMVSCSERNSVRENTLDALAKTDWGDIPTHVEMDKGQFKRRQERIEHTGLSALKWAAQKTQADYILFLEDDLLFSQHLRHNLEQWPPLRRGEAKLASLYNPGVQVYHRCRKENWFTPDPKTVFGAQAFLLTPDFVSYCVHHWWEIPGMQDIKVSRLATRLGLDIFYHMPSLVQHRDVPSVWGGARHEAIDFDAEWRAMPLAEI